MQLSLFRGCPPLESLKLAWKGLIKNIPPIFFSSFIFGLLFFLVILLGVYLVGGEDLVARFWAQLSSLSSFADAFAMLLLHAAVFFLLGHIPWRDIFQYDTGKAQIPRPNSDAVHLEGAQTSSSHDALSSHSSSSAVAEVFE